MTFEELKAQAAELQDSITSEDREDQPTLSRPPRIKIHQPLSQNAPEDSEPGWFYSDSSFCPPTSTLRAIIFKQNDGRRKSTPMEDPDNHFICVCPVSESLQGFPFVKGDDKKWHPGEEVRDCWFCPDYLPGKGTPKLEAFPETTGCRTYRQLALNLLIDDEVELGIPAKLEFGSVIFTKEYTSMSPFEEDGVTFGPVDFLTYSLKMLGGLPMHSVIVRIGTKSIKTSKGVAFAPVFGIEKVLNAETLAISRTFARENLPSLALSGKSALAELAEAPENSGGEKFEDNGINAPGDAFDVSQYSAAPPSPAKNVDEEEIQEEIF